MPKLTAAQRANRAQKSGLPSVADREMLRKMEDSSEKRHGLYDREPFKELRNG
jgi:hypothetical protein